MIHILLGSKIIKIDFDNAVFVQQQLLYDVVGEKGLINFYNKS